MSRAKMFTGPGLYTATPHKPHSAETRKKIGAAQKAARVARPREVRCRVCGCTEDNACDPPCAWNAVRTKGSTIECEDLCTSCVNAVYAVLEWHEGAVRPNFSALVREAKRAVSEAAS